MFSLRAFFKRKLIDKAVIACTKSSVPVFVEDFKEKAGMEVPVIEDAEDFVKFFKGKEKVCIIKHSMFEKAGNDLMIIKKLEKIALALENEKIDLDESLKLYEEGVKLAARCAEELESAKRKIQILQSGKNGEIEVVDVPEGTFADNG